MVEPRAADRTPHDDDAPLGPVDPATYQAFVAGLDLERVETVDVSATRMRDAAAVRVESELTPSFAVDVEQGAVFYRFDLSARLLAEDDEADVSATVDVALVLVFVSRSGIADRAVVEQFGGTSALLIAHPYLRESLASLAARVGHGGVSLPLQKVIR